MEQLHERSTAPRPEPASGAPREKSTLARWRAIVRTFLPFARRHRRSFLLGSVAALCVVSLRIALPWPLRLVMKPSFGHDGGWSGALVEALPQGLAPIVAMAGVFLVLMVALGFADHLERQQFARFAIGLVRDVRAKALKRAFRERSPGEGSGDLVARLIGDTARLKAGLQGFLVHVATNGAMFLGITVVLLCMDLAIGSIFAAAGAILAACTAMGAVGTYRHALEHRSREGKLAQRIDRAWRAQEGGESVPKIKRSSARLEHKLTTGQGHLTWLAHGVLGLAMLGAAIAGTGAVEAGRLETADLFLVFVYGLLLRAPLVQLTRQGVRTGKVLACGRRLRKLLRAGKRARSARRHAAQEAPRAPLPDS